MTNGYKVPGRPTATQTDPAKTTFESTSSEEYFYCIEVTPTYDRSGSITAADRMAPVVDDVQVVYMSSDTATVIEEVELVE